MNDHFRDTARRFWLQQNVSLGDFAQRFAASSDLFARDGKRPAATINLITAHGFTLRDCVCFNQKTQSGERRRERDGTNNNNYSNNHAYRGLEANLAVIERRRDSVHALLTTLLLSQGTPMLLAGDEHGHSQHGNNNAYCQDNALTWLDWRRKSRVNRFVAALIHLRRRIPALTRNQWWQEQDGNVSWLNQRGRTVKRRRVATCAARLQILLSDRWLIALNATAGGGGYGPRGEGAPFLHSPER